VILTNNTSHIRGYRENTHHWASSIISHGAFGSAPVSVPDTMGGGVAGLWNVTFMTSGRPDNIPIILTRIQTTHAQRVWNCILYLCLVFLNEQYWNIKQVMTMLSWCVIICVL